MNEQNILELANKSFNINTFRSPLNDDFNNRYLLEEYNDIKEDIINNEQTFYIYVTGIADQGGTINGKPINIPGYSNTAYTANWWDGGICNHVIPLIPARFTKIKIRYYDPIDTDNGPARFNYNTLLEQKRRSCEEMYNNLRNTYIVRSPFYYLPDYQILSHPDRKIMEDKYLLTNLEYQKEINELDIEIRRDKDYVDTHNYKTDDEYQRYMAIYLEYLNEHLIKEDNKNPRINSRFYKDFFPTDVISKTKEKSYIVLDLGHVFSTSLTEKGCAHFLGSYNPLDRDNPETFKLNTIYPNDVLEFEPISRTTCINKRLFKVNDDNTVITYLDKFRSLGIIQGGYNEGPLNINIVFEKIVNYMIKKIASKYNRDRFFLKNIAKPIYLRHLPLTEDALTDIIWNNEFNNCEELLQIIKRTINFTPANETALNQEIENALRPHLI